MLLFYGVMQASDISGLPSIMFEIWPSLYGRTTQILFALSNMQGMSGQGRSGMDAHDPLG